MSSRVESCKLTNMCLLKKDNQILVQERIKDDWPGLTFPGGHVEKGEGLKDAMIREFKEETGITLLNPILKGIEEFKTKDEDRYFIFFYVASEYLGEISSNSEGEVFWIDEKDIFNFDSMFLRNVCFCADRRRSSVFRKRNRTSRRDNCNFRRSVDGWKRQCSRL